MSDKPSLLDTLDPETRKKLEKMSEAFSTLGKRLAVCVPIAGVKSAVAHNVVELARAGHVGDIHKWTLENDADFLAYARAIEPDFDNLPFEEKRMRAKRWNFGKLYSGGLDVVKSQMDVEALARSIPESEVRKKERAFNDAWARMKARMGESK
jgi:hypothetical protein